MAKHDEKFFEHELSEKFAELDKNIKIPEIPDIQNIFEKAEEEKTNVVPFKKYSRYIAAAAAVVLICVSIPLISPALSAESAPQEPAEASDFYFTHTNLSDSDGASEEEMPVQESAEEPSEEMPESENEFTEATENINDSIENSVLTTTLREYFSASSNEKKEQISSGMSSSAVEQEIAMGDDLSLIEFQFNKKRSIEVSVEKDSVSVRVFDDSAGGEVISAFWVEGTFEDAYKNGEFYVIKLAKTVSPEELEEDFYLPMAGDTINGTYTIPEESVTISEKITRGVISLSVEINVGTGEYKIFAELV